MYIYFFFFSSRRRHTRCYRDWSSDVCSSDLTAKLRPKRAQVSNSLDDVARPGFTLRSNQRSAFAYPPKRFSQVPAAAYEGNPEGVLVDVEFFIRRGEHFTFVDEVHFQCFQDLCFDKVADPAFGHHRNAHCLLNIADHFRVAGPGHDALLADLRWNALQRHHRAGAGLLRDSRLIRTDHVHNHSAAQHLGQTYLRRPCRLLHRLSSQNVHTTSSRVPSTKLPWPLPRRSTAAQALPKRRAPSINRAGGSAQKVRRNPDSSDPATLFTMPDATITPWRLDS